MVSGGRGKEPDRREMGGNVTPRSRATGRHHATDWGTLSRHILWSFGSLRTSPTNNTTVLSPRFFHQCEVPCVSARISPALCTIGAAQLLAYSLISPSAT